ncbi:hypothetical protein [Micromonospora sp. CA-111912]|uniref:hypothetical protein n=1 Tax=Micromonospora sp. CA-111912 TaxID=3239955 RepID=UPI003D94B6E8
MTHGRNFGLLTTFEEAREANPYELARHWSDVSSLAKFSGFETRHLAYDIDELATMAALGKCLVQWLPIAINKALLAGGTVGQLATAAGMSPQELAATWREWSHGQRWMWGEGLIENRARAHDRVEEILAVALGERTCADCGGAIPTGTPPYPADMDGNGRLCSNCQQRAGVDMNDLVECTDCPARPLFDRAAIDHHRHLTHRAR